MKIDLKALKAARKYTAAYFITAVNLPATKPGSGAAAKRAGFKVGLTVAAARAAAPLTLADFDWHVAKGYVTLSARKPAAKKPAAPKPAPVAAPVAA